MTGVQTCALPISSLFSTLFPIFRCPSASRSLPPPPPLLSSSARTRNKGIRINERADSEISKGREEKAERSFSYFASTSGLERGGERKSEREREIDNIVGIPSSSLPDTPPLPPASSSAPPPPSSHVSLSSSSILSLGSSFELVPRIISYNINSLSYYVTSIPGKSRQRTIRNCLKDFITRADLICLQETNLAEKERFALSLPGCHVSRNNFAMGVAGSLIVETPAFLKFYKGEDVPLPALCRGHVQLRKYVPIDCSRSPFQLFNFYLKSGGEYGFNLGILASLLSVDSPFPTFLCGDLNFVERAEDTSSANPSLPPANFIEGWEKFKQKFDLCEVPHDQHTRFQISSDLSSPFSSSSRLDRFFIPSFLFGHPIFFPSISIAPHPSNFSPSSLVPRHFSDHLPISLSFYHSTVPKKKNNCIPDWVASNPMFKETVESLWKPNPNSTSFAKLRNFKKVLFKASLSVKSTTLSPLLPCLAISQHITLLKLISSRPQNLTRISSLLARNNNLSSLITFADNHWVDNGLLSSANSLLIHNSPSSSPPLPRNPLRALSDSLPSSRLKIASLKLENSDEDDFTAEGKSRIASDYWSKIWKPRATPTPPKHRSLFLKFYTKKVDRTLISSPSLDDVKFALSHSKDSTPGPDGIPFSAWRATVDLAAPILLGTLLDIQAGITPPTGFNFGLLFLLPKKFTGLVSDTRPLSVTNTDNRLLAAVVAKSIMPAVLALVDPSQKGFLSGVSGAEHITDINTFFFDAVKSKVDKILFLLDTEKAFDSIDHEWIHHVLAKTGFPRPFRNFVKGVLSKVQVSPVFGGEPVWVRILRGVKQGCPLSPLLFLLSYDPLLHHLSLHPDLKLFAFADDLAITSPTIASIFPALSTINTFSEVSGLGVNKKKSTIVPTSPPCRWPAISDLIRKSPWPDLTISPAATHLGIRIGRDVTLADVWSGAVTKAIDRINLCKGMVRALPLHTRILFLNVFIVSIFSYISLFFILPVEIWKSLKTLISRSFIPYRGGGFTYESLVCITEIYGAKPALKDVWAFNISLLAVRSPFFSSSLNYHQLPSIDIRHNMHITDHRDAAAVDFWRSRHLPTGQLLPVSPPTSPTVYKTIIKDVYLDDVISKLGLKISNFLFLNLFSPSSPLSSPSSIASSIISSLSCSSLPSYLRFFHMSFVNNALASSRRMRHQNKLSVASVDKCFFCILEQDSIAHIFSCCVVIREARRVFFTSLGYSPSSFFYPLHPPLSFSFCSSFHSIPTYVIIIFNFAVWSFRQPSLASRPEMNETWLVNRIVENATSIQTSIKNVGIKKRSSGDHLGDLKAHKELVLSSPEGAIFCYTDGSASPNPGPAGAGACLFNPFSSTVIDLGAPLGLSTNNAAEIYSLGMLFSFLINATLPTSHDFVVFSDSKFALSCLTSLKKPVTNSALVIAARVFYKRASSIYRIHLHWVRGHARIGGNERADKLSSNFASRNDIVKFNNSFPCEGSSFKPKFSAPFSDLPLSFFLNCIPRPAAAGCDMKSSL